MRKPRIGFIGQGYIGKNYADDFEQRGFQVVRYGQEAPFAVNKGAIASCDVVFVAVPTPTTLEGFDLSIVESVIPLANVGATVVVKSTVSPGSTEHLAQEFPDRFIMHSPEFLREMFAAEDAAHPERTIIGIPKDTAEYRRRAEETLLMLPRAPFSRIVPARVAELVKYAGNNFLYLKVVYANLLFDLSESLGVSYGDIVEILAADARIGASHLSVLHASGHSNQPGRGAGGHCLIKDFEAFRRLYASVTQDAAGNALLNALVAKNNELLRKSGKDLDLLGQVYGPLS